MIEKLPEPYRSKYKELIERIENTPGRKPKRKLFNDFVKKYTAIPDIWKLWIIQEPSELETVLKEKALTHFFDENFLHFLDEDNELIISRNNRKFSFVISFPYFHGVLFTFLKDTNQLIDEIDYALSFPHYYLKHLYYYCREYSDHFPAEKLKKLFSLEKYFQNLMAAFDNEDVEEWYRLLLQRKNNNIIIQNMEYYIAKKPYQKEAWKKYIQFLDGINFNKSMLGVYSRYCRFFLDDDEMKNEYFQKVLQLHHTGEDVKIWFFDSKEILLESNLKDFYDATLRENGGNVIELIKAFEKYTVLRKSYEKKIADLEDLEEADIWFMNDELNFMKTFDTDTFIERTTQGPLYCKEIGNCQTKWNNSNMKSQIFSLPENILYYISQHYGIRQKLYQTCKYFFEKLQTPLCHLLLVDEDSDEIEIDNQSFMLPAAVFNLHNTKSYSTSLINYLCENMTFTSTLFVRNLVNINCFTQIFKTFKNLHIKYIAIRSQTVHLQDLILLNHNCDLISCSLYLTDVINADGSFASVDDVITNLPTLKKFTLACPNLRFTENTAKVIASISPVCKFQEFIMMSVTDKFQSVDFCNFLKKQTTNNCKFLIVFDENVNEDYHKAFYRTVRKFLDSWEPQHYAPSFLLPTFPRYYDPLP